MHEHAHKDLGDSVCADEQQKECVVLRCRDAESVPSHGGLKVYWAADLNISLSVHQHQPLVPTQQQVKRV